MANFAGGTYEEQQKDPVIQLVASGSYRDIPKYIMQDYFDARISQEKAISLITGTPVYNPASGPIINQGTGPVATPARLPGESIETFTQRLDGKTPSTGTTPISQQDYFLKQGESQEQYHARIAGLRGTQATPPPTPPPVAVGISEIERIKEHAKALREALGLGERPALQDLFGEADKAKLNKARQERETIQLESEKILEERLGLEEEFRKFQATAGVGVTEAGRAGAVSEEGRKFQAQFDVLNRRELVLETKLRNRNTIISELVGLQRQEYSDAVTQYNTQFSQALQLYGVIDKDEDELKTNAKANLDVYSKAIQAQIEAKKLTFDQITPIQKAKIEELELQAGFQQGVTMAVLQTLKPKETQLYAGVDSAGNFNVVTKDADGIISLKRIEGVGATGTDDVREYNFYVQQERANGRTPKSFLEYMQIKGKAGGGEDPEIILELIDAQNAIENGADPGKVRQRFMQKYPNKGELFLKYFKEEF